MPCGSIIAFGMCILFRSSPFDMLDQDVGTFGPLQNLVADVFSAAANPNACRLAAPFEVQIQALMTCSAGSEKSTTIA